MAEQTGNSNQITRRYLDSLLIETRFLNSDNPCLTTNLYGKTFASPVMTAAMSHLDHFMFDGATLEYAKGAAMAKTVLWLGMESDETIEVCAGVCPDMIEIIKPYRDRELIFRKVEHAQKLGLLAVGIDIDHPFGPDGGPDIVDGYEMKTLTTAELKEICDASSLPVIAKGVLSLSDALQAVEAGAGGLVLSHHNNRIHFAMPPLAALQEIKKAIPADLPVFVDGEIRSGMDAFKALALGASGVSIGRPLMTAIKQGGAAAVAEHLAKVNGELGKAMAFTGCTSMEKMDPTAVRFLGWL